MNRLKFHRLAGLALTFAVLSNGVCAGRVLSMDDGTQPGAKFKLHVSHFEPAGLSEMLISDGWKPPVKVDSQLVDKIGQVRLALPNWQGVHCLAPGRSSK